MLRELGHVAVAVRPQLRVRVSCLACTRVRRSGPTRRPREARAMQTVFRTSQSAWSLASGVPAREPLASGCLGYLRYPLQISSAPLYYTQLQGPQSTEALASPQPRPSGRRNGEPPAGEPTKLRVAAAPKCGQCGRRSGRAAPATARHGDVPVPPLLTGRPPPRPCVSLSPPRGWPR